MTVIEAIQSLDKYWNSVFCDDPLRGKIKKQSIINVPGYGYKLNLMDDQ